MNRSFHARLAALGLARPFELLAPLTTLLACAPLPPSSPTPPAPASPTPPPAPASPTPPPAPAAPSPTFTAREEIRLLRSIREEQAPTVGFCAAERIGFEPFPADAERAFSFWSIETRTADARVVQTQAARVASLRACFGPTAQRPTHNFYAEIQLGAATFHGRGECSAVNVDFPEPGLIPVHCFLVLRDLPAPYVGGLLTTNTLTSKAPYGGDTNPPGYSQASIATVRLWK